MMFPADHPASFVLDFAKQVPGVSSLEFSAYHYTPKQVSEIRRTYRISVAELNTKLPELIASLRAEEELAIHSRVWLRSTSHPLHIPMIDFSATKASDCEECVVIAASEFGIRSSAVFHTGRSYHFYGFSLLDPNDWVRFMARMLLVNQPGRIECVDSRWVGHRLLAGYSSLRWTCSSQLYLQLPRMTGTWTAPQQSFDVVSVAGPVISEKPPISP